MGYAGVVNYKGLRIGGVSGIFKKQDYFRGHYESPPYDPNSLRSVYHYREQVIFRLQQLDEHQIDIMMSHDWPTDVHEYGNAVELIEFKPHFRDQIRDNVLGSPPLYELLKKLKPRYWFSAHLHCKFAAVIPHDDETETNFLGLDKCIAGRQFLQILDIANLSDDGKNDYSSSELEYDLEWLSILYTTKQLMHVEKRPTHMPEKCDALRRWNFQPTNDEKEAIRQKIGDNLEIPKNFVKTAASYDPLNRYAILRRSSSKMIRNQNQQTIEFCKILDIDDPLNLIATNSRPISLAKN